ncbi:glycosyltransferase family 4 protein [Winogradskyella alexanderae]|uniref:Glycosyltransferase family 4 protein n=1 Tax=Winogradskyella alexanderae TaxID=2877123 RepID=A0ABS7XSQ6_9FLAO|nr:glycosyltransferase family 4 protein [Winogradskyella alexanderae]MCA0132443.1 glycosyltransferase family 4 protein [Winogradskyella alexanderae]
MDVVFLVINYMPHQLISIKEILTTEGVTVHSFSYKEPHTTPYRLKNLKTYRLKDLSRQQFLKKLMKINPELIVVAGWAVSDFVWVAKKVRKKLNIPIVSYSDTQWQGTIKQKINCLISPWHLKKAFSHIWAAGIYQYEYARKLGFAKPKIITNALSCDVQLFSEVSIKTKRKTYPKNFLFIGRFVPVKGLNLLIKAWNQISDKKGWTLTLVGDGPQKNKIYNLEDVILKNYMTQKEIREEFEQAGCFILPSIYEPWALVIHEAAVAGLPIIATNVCGAAPHFIITGYNGYKVQPSVEDIKTAMENIMALTTEQLLEFSKNSRKLSSSITPELGAAQLLSVIK